MLYTVLRVVSPGISIQPCAIICTTFPRMPSIPGMKLHPHYMIFFNTEMPIKLGARRLEASRPSTLSYAMGLSGVRIAFATALLLMTAVGETRE